LLDALQGGELFSSSAVKNEKERGTRRGISEENKGKRRSLHVNSKGEPFKLIRCLKKGEEGNCGRNKKEKKGCGKRFLR